MRWLKTQASNLWRRELLQESSPTSPPSRIQAYSLFHQPDLHRQSRYRPAPYVYTKNPYLLNLCRLRVQGWTQLLPTHLHYTTSRTRTPYENRHCPHCPNHKELGDETHLFLSCPALDTLREKLVADLNARLRQFDGPGWQTLSELEQTRVILGNHPPRVLKKYAREWMTETIPVITSFIHDLQLQLRLPQPHTITDDDIDDDLPEGDDPYQHTPCHVCRRQDQEDTMLLCDDCDRDYHLHCLSPPLRSVPRGKWRSYNCTG